MDTSESEAEFNAIIDPRTFAFDTSRVQKWTTRARTTLIQAAELAGQFPWDEDAEFTSDADDYSDEPALSAVRRCSVVTSSILAVLILGTVIGALVRLVI